MYTSLFFSQTLFSLCTFPYFSKYITLFSYFPILFANSWNYSSFNHCKLSRESSKLGTINKWCQNGWLLDPHPPPVWISSSQNSNFYIVMSDQAHLWDAKSLGHKNLGFCILNLTPILCGPNAPLKLLIC